MKTYQVVIKSAFLVSMKIGVFLKLCKLTAKRACFKIFSNVHTTARKSADENLKQISLVVWKSELKNSFIKVIVISVACEKVEELNFCWSLFLAIGLKISFFASKLKYFGNFRKKIENWTAKCHPELRKLKMLRAVSESMSAESALFRDFQVIYSAESELRQRCSALSFSESEMISAEILRRLILGFPVAICRMLSIGSN